MFDVRMRMSVVVGCCCCGAI